MQSHGSYPSRQLSLDDAPNWKTRQERSYRRNNSGGHEPIVLELRRV